MTFNVTKCERESVNLRNFLFLSFCFINILPRIQLFGDTDAKWFKMFYMITITVNRREKKKIVLSIFSDIYILLLSRWPRYNMEQRLSMLVTLRKSLEIRCVHFIFVNIGLCIFLFVCLVFHLSVLWIFCFFGFVWFCFDSERLC